MNIPGRSSLSQAAVRSLDGLTSLRILPALYVLIFHYGTMFFRGVDLPDGIELGYSGVTFFFMLSGFILAYNYASVDLADPDVRRRYAIARFARIYPLFILSILVAMPLFFVAIYPLHGVTGWSTAVLRVVLTVLGLHAWVPGAACAINCPSWSISTEFFFYAAFPFVLPLILRAPKVWLAITIAVLATSWCVLGLAWETVGPDLELTSPDTRRNAVTNLVAQFVMYFPVARLPEFLLGILLYVYWSRAASRLSAAVLATLAALAAAILLAVQSLLPDVVLSNGLTVVVWAPLILACAISRAPLLGAAIPLRLGRISFAIYLFHLPVGQAVLLADAKWFGRGIAAHPWAAAIGATTLTVAAAMLAYALVEEPARRRILRGFHRNRTL